jgi:UDP-glucose 4-epimerase
MKVLITGAGGVLGRYVVRKFIECGFEVRGFDLFPPPDIFQEIPWIVGDIRDKEKVERATEGISCVVHLAGRMPQWERKMKREGLYAVNVEGTKNLVTASIKNGVRYFLFASTVEIFGPQKRYPLREEDEPLFTGEYSRQKYECERILTEVCNKTSLRGISLRLPMIFGEGFYHERAITTLFDLVHKGLPILLFCDPEIPFTSVHGEDAGSAFVLALKARIQDEGKGKWEPHEVFTIAGEDLWTTEELFLRFVERVGSRSRIIKVPLPLVRLGVKIAVHLPFSLPFLYTPAELIPFALTGAFYSIEKAKEKLDSNQNIVLSNLWKSVTTGISATERSLP